MMATFSNKYTECTLKHPDIETLRFLLIENNNAIYNC